MDREQAIEAMNKRLKVEGGQGEDHDTGWIVSIDCDMAEVSWDSGMRAPCPIELLDLA